MRHRHDKPRALVSEKAMREAEDSDWWNPDMRVHGVEGAPCSTGWYRIREFSIDIVVARRNPDGQIEARKIPRWSSHDDNTPCPKCPDYAAAVEREPEGMAEAVQGIVALIGPRNAKHARMQENIDHVRAELIQALIDLDTIETVAESRTTFNSEPSAWEHVIRAAGNARKGPFYSGVLASVAHDLPSVDRGIAKARKLVQVEAVLLGYDCTLTHVGCDLCDRMRRRIEEIRVEEAKR